RKCAATVTTHAAIAINDDFAPGQAGVAMGTADHETAGGIDVIVGLAVHHVRGHHGVDDVLLDIRPELLGGDVVIVLRGEHHSIDAPRLAVHVLDADLALPIGTKVGQLAFAAIP